MIRFEHPEAFLLAAPILALFRRSLAPRSSVAVLRLLLLAVLLAALARPYRPLSEPGRDVVVIADRSHSIDARHAATIQEIAAAAGKAALPGDRLSIVDFARHAVVAENAGTAVLEDLDRDATDLAAALDLALSIVPEGRRASLVVASDGEVTGRDTEPAAREAARRGIRIDAYPLRRAGAADVSVGDVRCPPEAAPGEPFQLTALVESARSLQSAVSLLRNGEVISRTTVDLRPGANQLRFRDRVSEPGIHHYEVAVEGAADRTPENDRGAGVVRVSGSFRALCLTPEGRDDRLTRSLRNAGIEVVHVAPRAAPLDPQGLDSFRVVVFENFPAREITGRAASAVKTWVEHWGGGLLMTGGPASFGIGGWRKTPIEDALPVDLHVRREHRKFSVAMAIALDRSGSMAAPASGGRTKMDLANLGACAAVELLSGDDAVGVIAVDSSPHVVVPLTSGQNRTAICEQIRTIESSGGGIFTATAIHAAADQLADAGQGARHIVLFADAADAEEPGDYATFVPKLAEAGVTISVIGLGSESDSDAAFLKDVARLGRGRVFFASTPEDLPRVFAEEAIQVMKSAIVREPSRVETLPGLRALGLGADVRLPAIGGYCVAYTKPSAQEGAVTANERRAPIAAFHQFGLGRSAAFLGEADGPLSGELATWDRYADFFATTVRWLGGNEAAEDLFVELERDGHEALVRIERDRRRTEGAGSIVARVLGPDGQVLPVPLVQQPDGALAGRVALTGKGIWRAAVEDGANRIARAPPIAISYSPEFEPHLDAAAGERLLARLAAIGGGSVEPPMADLFSGPRDSVGWQDLSRFFAWAALALLLLEIAFRRLAIRVPAPAFVGRTAASVRSAASRLRARVARPPAGPPAPEAPAPARPAAPPSSGPRPDEAPVPEGLDAALKRAKARARKKG